MEQVYNSMLYMAQAMTERQTSQNMSQTQEKDGFQKLMSEKQPAKKDAGANPKTETIAKEGAQQETEPTLAEDSQTLEKQMVLAAMAILQNPVVPAEQVAAPEEQAVELALPLEALTANVQEVPQAVNPELAEAAVELEAELQPQEKELAETFEVKAQEGPIETVQSQESGVQVKAVETAGTEQGDDNPDAPKENLGGETPVFHEVRDIPVKVGEAPAAAQTQEIPVEEQVGAKLTEALQSGDTHVEIQLAPENLGKVTVEVTLHEDGALHVAIHAENSRTHSLLERSTDSLAAALARETRQEVQVEVPRQQESQQQNLYDGRQGHGHQGRQQQQQRQDQRGGEDFLHQLRLGLVPVDEETV